MLLKVNVLCSLSHFSGWPSKVDADGTQCHWPKLIGRPICYCLMFYIYTVYKKNSVIFLSLWQARKIVIE